MISKDYASPLIEAEKAENNRGIIFQVKDVFELIYQRPVTGLDLRASNFAVILFASWLDCGMHTIYRQGYKVTVGLS